MNNQNRKRFRSASLSELVTHSGPGIYMARRSGSVGHEILNPEGEVIAWANGLWAMVIVALLNQTGVNNENPMAQIPSLANKSVDNHY